VPCRSVPKQRKPLFPPPRDATTGKRCANKGLQPHRIVTVNGEIEVCRRWWHDREQGSVAPADAIVDRTGASITPGVVELAARVNVRASSFREASAVLERLGLLPPQRERASRAVFGEESPEGKAWADALMHCFKHDEYALAWEKIIQWRAGVQGTAKRKAADRLLNFASTRKEMIRYPAFPERGWQIGSGPTESQCGLCTKRLKGYGRRWDRPSATAVAAVDTLHRNAQWHQVWPNVLATAT